VARNALLGFALLAAVAGCSPAGGEAEAQAAEAQLAALRAHNDSVRQARIAMAPDTGASSTLAATTASSAGTDSLGPTEAEVADSIRKAREIEVMRETFAYSGGSRDPFASLLNTTAAGPEIGSLELVGVYQNLRNSDNSVVVLRDKGTAKRYKLRVGDQVGRAKLVQIKPRDAVFTIRDFGYERQETLSLRKQEVETP
jgi:hypothetical protein